METKNADLSSLKIDRSENKNPESKKTKYIITVVVIIILAVAGYYGYNQIVPKTLEVKVTTAVLQKPGQTGMNLTASGYVVAQRKAAIASKGTGRLIYLGVVEGDQVRKDQIIGRLEDNDIKAQLEQAKANLKVYQADSLGYKNEFDRQKDLLAKGLTTQREFDDAQANYKRIIAQIEVARAQILSSEVALENTLIRAPFDGTVLTKNAEVGEIVAPLGGSTTSKTAVVTIADMKSLLVETDVSEANIEKITLNQNCDIVLDAYPEKSYAGFVFKVVPTADRSKATVLVKVGFKSYDSRVLPEMSAKVLFYTSPMDSSIIDQKPVLVIPTSAVTNLNGNKVVFKIADGKASVVNIQTGERFGSYIEVTSGLKSGDEIIETVDEKIKDGTVVKAIEK